MTPVRNQVLVKPFPSDEISEGGIFVPLSARKISNKVRVIKVGNGTINRPMRLKEGDVGYRVQDAGVEIIYEGEPHFLVEDSAILAKEN